LIKDLVNFLNPTIRNKKIQFSSTIDIKINPSFFANRFHIYRVILNLLSNAIKFTDSQGKGSLAVKLLKAEADKQHLEIKVSDTGIGIPKESFEKIFDRYTRLTPSHSSQYKGSGLGLYIVKRMVEDMGGSVSVESKVGKGSTFSVALPLLLASEKPTPSFEKPETLKKPTKLKSKKVIRVLVVEDNPLAMKMAKTLFEFEGCQVDMAETGNKAVEKFAHNVYQLVIMDIGLPDMPGYEVTEKFRQYEQNHQQSPTVILGLTAHVQKEELDRGVSSGMNKVFSKPITALLTKNFLDLLNGKNNEAPHSEETSSLKPKAALTSAISKLPVIDLELGAKILGTNLESAKAMIKSLVEMLPGDLQDLKTAFREKDNQKLKNKAHYIKGGASYCGTPRLKLAATELDNSIKEGADPVVIKKSYQDLCQEIELLIKEYEKLSK
jgi:two-component system aerobic respiration control sensor histidine kinase ArcB